MSHVRSDESPAKRPMPSRSLGGETAVPPSSEALATDASQSATAKIVIQNAGASSGVPGGTPMIPAIGRSPRLKTPASSFQSKTAP